MLTSRPLYPYLIVLILVCIGPGFAAGEGSANGHVPREVNPTPGLNKDAPAENEQAVFLPVVFHPFPFLAKSSAPRINAPYFDEEILFKETGIFWFGKVNQSENYTDVRVGYNDEELYVHLAIFDRTVWYDKTPSPPEFAAWDSASLYINLKGSPAASVDATSYRFDGQLSWSEERDAFQAAYRGSSGNWTAASIPFTTETGWRGDAPNIDTKDDRGWRITYHIPFSSLGFSAPPPQGTTWGIAVSVFDRDDEIGTPIPEKRWPDGMDPVSPTTWGSLAFGFPSYTAAPSMPAGNVTIRHGLNGVTVEDGMVGGGTDCGDAAVDTNFFIEWGEANYAGAHQVNVQNQYDVSDWPCFSKFYLTFPMDSVPAGKTILEATLTVYQFSNAGGGEYGIPPGSLIQVSEIQQDWDEATLTWNNAPQAWENISSSYVDWIDSPIPWPGAPRSWDVSVAVARAYQAGQPLRIVLYTPDAFQHSGKYFTSSDTGDWNEEGRPTLQITWGE